MPGRWQRLVAATIAATILSAGLAQSGSGDNPPPPPPGAIGYGIPVPPPGNASLFQFHFNLVGGTALPTPTFPTGMAPPAGIELFLDLIPNLSGGADLNALIVNPFPASAAGPPAASGALNFWIVPGQNETLSPAGSGPAFVSINQWPAAAPAACKNGALANRSVFAPPDALGFSLNKDKGVLEAVNALLAVVLPMQIADDFICDRPTSATEDKALGLPYAQASYGTGLVSDVRVGWHDFLGVPDLLLVTGFPVRPALSGRDAKECKAGSRSTENFVSCKPGSRQQDIRVGLKTSPRFKIKNLKAAIFVAHQEFGPFG